MKKLNWGIIAAVVALGVAIVSTALTRLSGKTAANRPVSGKPSLRVAYTGNFGPLNGEIRVASIEKGALANNRTLMQVDNYEGLGEVRFSPQGDKLLAAADLKYSWATRLNNLYLFDISSGKKTTLRGDEAGYHNLRWSPDGRLISYISREGIDEGPGGENSEMPPNNLYCQDPQTGKRTKILAHVYQAAWVEGGGIVIRQTAGDQVILVNPRIKRHRTIYKDRWAYIDSSRDGRVLILYDYRGNTIRAFHPPSQTVARRHPWSPFLVVRLPGKLLQPVIAPDGTAVAVTFKDLHASGANDYTLALIQLDSRTVRVFRLRTADGWVGYVPPGGGKLLTVAAANQVANPAWNVYSSEAAAAPEVPLSHADWQKRTPLRLTKMAALQGKMIFSTDWFGDF